MATLNFNGESYACSRAQKGTDFVRLLDENGSIVFLAEGISDFSGYELVDGSWENPMAIVAPTIGAQATLTDDLIVLDIPATVLVETGLPITFSAPCNCDATTGISIRGTTYTIVDAMGNDIVELSGGAFCSGAVLSVILDVPNSRAYLQNAASSLSAGAAITDISVTKNADGITLVGTMADGAETTHLITLDANGYPNRIVTDNLDVCNISWEGFDA